jgi:hypothetical protein
MTRIAEVRFYFTKTFDDETWVFTLVSPYSAPVEHLLCLSNGTLVVCQYQEELLVVEAHSILQVVAMVPFPFLINNSSNWYYLIEKIGLSIADVDIQYDNVDGQ